jgi:ABC-type multidrug transport system fused ATPase/permease subunit
MQKITISSLFKLFIKKNYMYLILTLLLSRYIFLKTILIPRCIINQVIKGNFNFINILAILVIYFTIYILYKYVEYIMSLNMRCLYQEYLYTTIINVRYNNPNINFPVSLDRFCLDLAGYQGAIIKCYFSVFTYIILVVSIAKLFFKESKFIGSLFLILYSLLFIVVLNKLNNLKKYKKISIIEENKITDLNQDINANLTTILSFNEIKNEKNKIENKFKNHKNSEKIFIKKENKIMFIFQIISNCIFLLIILICFHYKKNNIFLQTQLIYILGIIFNYIIFTDKKLVDNMLSILMYTEYSTIAIQTINDILQLEDNSRSYIDYNKTNLKVKMYIKTKNNLYLKNIRFSLTNNDLYDNLNIEFYDKTINCIVGKIGCGKSTLLKIIFGNLKTTNGTIRYGEQLLDYNYINDWKKNIHFLSQNPEIFNRSVEENIFYPLKNTNKFNELFKKVGVYEFVQKMLKKTVLSLSGGEKQLISIIRILLSPKRIILFDEPTSSLSTEKKQIVLNILNYLKKNCIIIIVSHDLYIINNVDKKFKLENGKLTGVIPDKIK